MKHSSIALIDVSALFARLWHGQVGRRARNEADVDTLRACGRIRSSVSHAIICCDAPPYTRKTLYAEYKAGREDPGADYYAKRDWVLAELGREGFPLAKATGYEGDDVIATLASAYRMVCDDVRLVGSDKDLYQLLNHKVVQVVPAQGDRPETIIDADEVKRRTGVLPAQMVDWQSLVGDSADNIPGCKGIGPKTAAQLLERYGSIDALYRAMTDSPVQANIDMGKATFDRLKRARASVLMSRQLVRLMNDAPLDVEGLLVPRKPKPRVMHDPFPSQFSPPRGDHGPDLTLEQENAMWEEGDRQEAEEAEEERRRQEAFEQARQDVARVVERESELPEPDPEPDPEPQPEPRPRARKRQDPDPDVALGAKYDQKGNDTKAEIVQMPSGNAQGMQVAAEYAFGLEPTNMEQAVWFAKVIHKGNRFPKHGDWTAILTIMIMGREIGLGAVASLMSFSMVEGRPTPSAQLITAFAKQHRDCLYFEQRESTNERATFATKRRGDTTETVLTYTIQDARDAGLVKPRGGWEKYPAAMLRKMCQVHLARTVYPDSKVNGLYCAEEMGYQEAA